MSINGLDTDDPVTQSMLLDLFTEIAILEHLVRERFKPLAAEDIDPRGFGFLNYFVRLGKASEKVSTLAWGFLVSKDEAMQTATTLARHRYVEIDWVDGEQDVLITQAGRDRHAEFIERARPDVAEIVSEIDPEHLRITAVTLKELRRTFDNLPGR